ncbi:hypothetical protein FACS1894152_6090 [Bacilli bacterium]|nr:hypothetical protein FACS1894152_6090 [Bacilli bacterium]
MKRKLAGSISDVTKIIRILLAGREQGPDLYSIMNVIGKDEPDRRIGENSPVAILN